MDALSTGTDDITSESKIIGNIVDIVISNGHFSNQSQTYS